MALIKTGTETATVTETENVTETVTAAAPETKDVAVKETAAAPAVAGVAGGGNFFIATPVMLQVIAEAEWGTFETISASNGSFNLSSTKKSVGSVLEFQAIGEKIKKVCSPGSNEPEAKDYFATCYEGGVCLDGSSIEEKLQEAKDAGYNKAKIQDYLDVFVKITDCAEKDSDIVGEIMVLQLAPVSKTSWNSFKNSLIMRSEMGEKVFGAGGAAPVIRATAKGEVNKNRQSYTVFKFSLVN